ncbi:MAG TPA: nucleoside hydrolase [Spirochaetia bacterium]|nr:nucleoside hydrolase [Spirochaetales bacterium]HRY79921.1 nucleoside hydrolase [Spirochaetia bacterium]HRZ88868.1 nucleoside hydrolase [Spirochaetia bacterium]
MAELPPLPRRRRRPLPLILDTDLNEDVDDAGALAVLHALADRGLAEILGMTYCTSARWGVPAIRAVNRWYGRPDIPVGAFGRPGFLDEHADLSYIRFLAEAYGPGEGVAAPGGPEPAAVSAQAEAVPGNNPEAAAAPAQAGTAHEADPEAVGLIRRLLAGRDRADAVLVGIGPMLNLAALLDSGPDGTSPLSGPDLVRRSVRKLVLMCGRIPEGIEYNLRQDPGAARRVLAGWPTPVVICDGELGGSLQAGARFCREAPRGNPVRTAYRLHTVGLDWACYDQAAVLAAVTGTRYFRLSAPGRLEVDREGSGRWTADPSGNHRYLEARFDPADLSRLVEDLMLAPPRSGAPAPFLPSASDEELLERRKAALAAHFRAVLDEGLEELEGAE